MLRFDTRRIPSALFIYANPLLALAWTAVGGGLLFAALGHDPGHLLYALFVQPLETRQGRLDLLVTAIPLVLCGVGLAMTFRANVWNLGAQGQLLVGAACAGAVALAFQGEAVPASLAPWLGPAVLVAGAMGGMAWAAIPAYLRTRAGASELLVGVLLVYVAHTLVSGLVQGPLGALNGFGLSALANGAQGGVMLDVCFGTAAAVAVGLVWLVLARTSFGIELQVVGCAPAVAAHTGIDPNRLIWVSLLAGGALAGVAGSTMLVGPLGAAATDPWSGYGVSSIVVAFLGRLHPVGVVLAAPVVALTCLAGGSAAAAHDLPESIAGVFQGMLLLCLLGCDVLVSHRPRFGVAVSRLATVPRR